MPPRLYHAPSSYYSMIARLALVEAGEPFVSVPMDIHRKKEQLEPAYARKNPNLTVPTFELDGTVLTESRDILFHALAPKGHPADDSVRAWVDRHYGFPIEDLTIGWLLKWNPLARAAVPRQLAAVEQKLRALADEHADLAEHYRARAEVFAARVRTFDAKEVAALFADREKTALGHLDALEAALADGRPTLVPPAYGAADVVWTAFLARLRFIRRGAEIARRPSLARYAESMFSRSSTKTADLWLSINPLKLVRQML
jgi:ganglioside-induced differentiation-associated protein 1